MNHNKKNILFHVKLAVFMYSYCLPNWTRHFYDGNKSLANQIRCNHILEQLRCGKNQILVIPIVERDHIGNNKGKKPLITFV